MLSLAESRININHNGREISVSLKRSRRARRLRLAVYRDGEVRLTAHSLVPSFIIRRFIEVKKEWIFRKRDGFLNHPATARQALLSTRSRKHYIRHKDEALRLVSDRINYFNSSGHFKVRKIAVRNQRSRWGSCSRSGNLSFNYKIVFLSESERDYIVVHELCHTREFNHSKAFWDLVSEYMPDHTQIRSNLRRA